MLRFCILGIFPEDFCNCFLRLRDAETGYGQVVSENPFCILDPAAVSEQWIAPTDFALKAFPNPFNSTLLIEFPADERGVLEVVDLAGRKLFERYTDNVDRTLAQGIANHRSTSILWQPADDIPSGILLIRWNAGTERLVQRALYLK